MDYVGTSVRAEKAVQFARVTGTQVSLHDLSLSYLAADYDPYMNLGERPTTSPPPLDMDMMHTLPQSPPPVPALSSLSIHYISPSAPSFASCYEAPFTEEEEDWDLDNFPPTTLAAGQPGGAEVHRVELAGIEYQDDEREVELDDFLMGDDPAMYSDEFSGPEEEF